MAKTWAISGVDLHLDIRTTRVRAALESALRTAVQSGRLHPGTRLPSTRALAVDLGIARNTVAEAYAQLVAEGWLTARTGSGTWVSDRVPAPRPVRRDDLSTARQLRYDLTPGTPDVSSFPRAAWAAATRRALAQAPAEMFGYGDGPGASALRQQLASYLARARGVLADPENIVICAGFQQGLAIVGRVLKRQGAVTIGMEQDGHRLHRDVLAEAGLRIRPIPVDGSGAQVERLADANAVLLTPAHQFPHGIPLAPERRRAVARWAAEQAAVVIEDDYDGEFRYDRQAIGALQPLAPDNVIYAGTASKTLAPALRLGWLVVPRRLLPAVLEVKRLTNGPHSGVDQLAFAELIRSGEYDRHVRQRRLVYRRRREHLVAALRRHAPWIELRGVPAGLHVVLTLPMGVSEDAVRRKAAAAGLAVSGLGEHALGGADRGGGGVVISYATPPDHDYSRAIARLCAVLADLGR